MEVELNTGNLRNLCRVCLGEGDYNLWEHKVNWNDSAAIEIGTEEVNQQDSQEITVHEVLQMYNEWQQTILDLDNELQFICKGCLDELQPHYHYYKRLQAANKQMKQLYEEALRHEQSKTIETEQMSVEHVAYENHFPEYSNIALEHSEPNEQPTRETAGACAEEIVKDKLSTYTATKIAQKRKFVKNPKFILTGGVTQLLAHATGATRYETILEDVSQLSEANIHCSPQKRKRTEADLEVPVLIVEDKTINDFFIDQTSDVVAQESVTDDCISKYEQEEYGTVQEVIQDLPPNEILTVEYTAANEQFHNEPILHDEEIQQQHEQQQHEENSQEKPIKSKNDELAAALPLSILSADDDGRSIYVCKYCPQAFTAPCFLLTHARSSHVCKYCNKAFVKTPDLFAHIKEAHKEHKCSVCGKELSSNGNLRAHMKRMHRLKTLHETAEITKNRTNAAMSIIKESGGHGGGETVYIDETNQSMTVEYLD